MRLDTVSLRGLFTQQIHGSKRSLRSVEDFTEFEQRTAYFNGDQIHAIKKGMNTFTLRGIKDSPPYMHDGRCLTLEDTVELFNLVLELGLAPEEKTDLAFMRQL